ncbi:recombination regulator RecX [Trinickia acidisoli]|uniref:recombination regulator RecX n=1 Tax=Trinickia acidisoli TaxID=2767482 RepID=UPI001A8EBE89|nr:recombination regulator RecX [Trinickia acidisoli]
MIRKGRVAPGGPREGRRFGAREGLRGEALGADVGASHADPLDPSSNHEASDSSSSASEGGGRSRRPTRSLKARAIDYLSRREYSRAELTRKLAPFVEEGDALDPLLDALEREGLLSDARFAESVMNRRSARMGASRIVGELRQHGLDGALIESVGSQLRDTERARAQAVWRKKFGQLPQSPAERAKQARFLAMRGFSGATISQILKGDDDWRDE